MQGHIGLAPIRQQLRRSGQRLGDFSEHGSDLERIADVERRVPSWPDDDSGTADEL